MKYHQILPHMTDEAPLAEQERLAYIAGDTHRAGLLALLQDDEAEHDKTKCDLDDALSDAEATRKVLAAVISAAETFVLDSKMDAKAIKALLNVLDNAKDSA